jgi:hypothetical protein
MVYLTARGDVSKMKAQFLIHPRQLVSRKELRIALHGSTPSHNKMER